MNKWNWLKIGSAVIVCKGRDRGMKSSIVDMDRNRGMVKVQGVHLATIHQKPSGGNKGGIVKKESWFSISNVAHVDPKTGKATRVGIRYSNGKKEVFAKKSGETVRAC